VKPPPEISVRRLASGQRKSTKNTRDKARVGRREPKKRVDKINDVRRGTVATLCGRYNNYQLKHEKGIGYGYANTFNAQAKAGGAVTSCESS
jgi:hypothetical protein